METAEPDLAGEECRQGRDLTAGSIPRHLVAFAVPMLIGNAIQAAYAFINGAWVGLGLGSSALAAITAGSIAFFTLIGIANGLTIGTGILVSQYYGAKDWDGLRRVVRNSVALTGLICFVCLAAGEILAGDLLRIMKTPADILPAADSYLRILLCVMPFMFGTALLQAILRGTGDSLTPVYFQAISIVLLALLNPVLMFGPHGLPRMGANGTAVATIIAQAGAFAATLVYLRRRRHIGAPDWLHLRMDWPTSKLLLKVGLPSMVQQGLFAAGLSVITALVNGFGSHAEAAMGASMRIDELASMPAWVISMSVSTLAAQNIGVKDFGRVREVFRWGLALSIGVTLLMLPALLVFPEIVVRCFLKDPAVIGIAARTLRIIGLGYIPFCIWAISIGAINGSGHTATTMCISLFTLWAVRIPLASHLSKTMHSLDGVWYGWTIGFAVGMTASLAYYLSGRWKRSIG